MHSLCIIKNIAAVGLNAAKSPLLGVNGITKIQSAGMLLKAYRDPDYKRPPAFPYKEKNYTILDSMIDRVIWRFDENSKIIIVDGPPASGITQVAKEIAEAYDLHYIPAVNLDYHYINHYGFDNRKMNDKLPFRLRSFDMHEFLADPYDIRGTLMHMLIYQKRLFDYVDALAHVLNTGQGVVMDRSVYSDIVFANTFTTLGFFPKNFDNHQAAARFAVFDELLKPHVVVYLDQSVDTTIKKIQQRNLPGEKNSPVYKPDALKLLEVNYKENLKNMEEHAEVLVYDWNHERDSEMIIEDIETLNLDDYAMNDTKMRDWRTEHFEHFWIDRRRHFTNDKSYFERWCIPPYFDCEEIWIPGHIWKEYDDVMNEAPGMEYAAGFNCLHEPYPYFKW